MRIDTAVEIKYRESGEVLHCALRNLAKSARPKTRLQRHQQTRNVTKCEVCRRITAAWFSVDLTRSKTLHRLSLLSTVLRLWVKITGRPVFRYTEFWKTRSDLFFYLNQSAYFVHTAGASKRTRNLLLKQAVLPLGTSKMKFIIMPGLLTALNGCSSNARHQFNYPASLPE